MNMDRKTTSVRFLVVKTQLTLVFFLVGLGCFSFMKIYYNFMWPVSCVTSHFLLGLEGCAWLGFSVDASLNNTRWQTAKVRSFNLTSFPPILIPLQTGVSATTLCQTKATSSSNSPSVFILCSATEPFNIQTISTVRSISCRLQFQAKEAKDRAPTSSKETCATLNPGFITVIHPSSNKGRTFSSHSPASSPHAKPGYTATIVQRNTTGRYSGC